MYVNRNRYVFHNILSTIFPPTSGIYCTLVFEYFLYYFSSKIPNNTTHNSYYLISYMSRLEYQYTSYYLRYFRPDSDINKTDEKCHEEE